MGGWRPGGPKSYGRYAAPKNLIAKIAKKSREDRKEKNIALGCFAFLCGLRGDSASFAFKGFFPANYSAADLPTRRLELTSLKILIAKIAKKSREDRKEKASRWVVLPFSAVSAATLRA